MTPGPWDPGLQNERTGLAWQRTMLSGLTCSLLVARLLADVALIAAVFTGLLALLGTALLGGMAIRRFRAYSRALHAGEAIGDARPKLVITGMVSLTAIGAMLFALVA
jgi:uncharacterized membrane protein YidH (DUF202 family)